MPSTEAIAAPEPAAWPLPTGMKLYVSIDQAAEITGVSRDRLRRWAADRVDPIPQLQCGSKVLLRTAALPAYLARKEAV